jgi:hypothetical protein
MNTTNLTTQIPATTNSGRAPASRKVKTAGPKTKTSAPAQPGNLAPQAAANSPAANAPAPAFITLAPSFIALADQFGMVPERLAERVIAAFAETKPARLVVKARASSGQSAH